MSYDGKLLAKAREQLEGIRAANQAEHARRQNLIHSRIPEIARIDERLRLQMSSLMGVAISHEPDMQEKLAALEKENLELQGRRAELLAENGYPIDYLDEIYSCQKCRDTGYADGGICSCLTVQYNRALTRELGVLLKNGDESFENFDLTYYDDVPDSTGESPRDYMRQVFETCREYAHRFSPSSPNLLFQGGTGLGKTFLSACIARVAADGGFSVCYDTASSALDAFESRKFSRDPETAEASSVKCERMLSCDLMILDDLGTEMVTQMSVSALYTLINTRLNDRKVTIISTNLTDSELAKKYSPQIISRLDGEYFRLPFAGRDIRIIKKEREG